jgi:phosphatidate cytidylyltransferase
VAGNEPLPNSGNGAGEPVRGNNLLLRIVSALVLAPLALIAAWLGGWPFALFWGVAATVVLWEWLLLVAGPDRQLMFFSCASMLSAAVLVARLVRPAVAIPVMGAGVLASAIFAPRERRLWVAGGVLYAGVLLLVPLLLRYDSGFGFFALLFVFAVVWTTDILGYFGGRAIGGPKLAPAVSPKKTWSGTISGAAGAMAVGAGLAVALGFSDVAVLAVIAFVLSAVAQGGDLMESAIKRHFGVKDASHLIPGHGGVMDRLDGFWAAALAGCLIGLARGGFDGAARGLLVW